MTNAGMKSERPKKDHKCSHDRKHATGMEVCRACGDIGICPQCGAEYIVIDTGARCYPCSTIERLSDALENAKREQEQRKAKYQAKGAM